MPKSEALAFAAKVVAKIQQQVLELSKEKGTRGLKPWCLALKEALAAVRKRLKASSASADRRLLEALPKLLLCLDRLAQWPAKSDPNPRGLELQTYKGLESIRRGSLVAKPSIRRLCAPNCSCKNQEKILEALQNWGGIEDPVDPDLDDVDFKTERKVRPPDYQAHVRILYNVLSRHCVCARGNPDTSISANLRLNSDACRVECESEKATFHLLFLDHPHNQEAGRCWWQDAVIQVSREKRVRVIDDSSGIVCPGGTVLAARGFCDFITTRAACQLQLEVSNGSLVQHGARPPERAYIVQLPSLSLATLVRSAPRLSPMARLRLCHELARAVWQFYDSDWMRQVWTKYTVHFMFRRPLTEKTAGLYVDDPLLLARFAQDRPSSEHQRVSPTHTAPKVLALGIMMMEVELGEHLEDHYPPECLDHSGVPIFNADHCAAINMWKKNHLWSRAETFSYLKSTIDKCLTPVFWSTIEQDSESERAAIYDEVVTPLRRFLEIAWETSVVQGIPMENFGFMDTSPQPLPAEDTSESTQPRPPQAPTTHSVSDHDVIKPRSRARRGKISGLDDGGFDSETWFEQLQLFNETLRIKPQDRDTSTPRSRVAILDTGICSTLQASCLVDKYYDFVDGDHEQWRDSTSGDTNHGTNVARLLRYIYGDAEICVGRVWGSGGDYTEATPARMAAAIKHACDVWAVDVIVIPSGFDRTYDCIRNAVIHAEGSGVLVFAAASNNSGLKDVAFPANMHSARKLFCIFATTPGGRAAAVEFNPIAPSPEGNSFAVIGKDIRIPQVPDPVSGTSYAAAVAAGIAARLLDFSKHRDVREEIRNSSQLRWVEGMSAVFKALCYRGLDGGHRCIAPWIKLLNVGEDMPRADAIKRRRQGMREILSTALEETY